MLTPAAVITRLETSTIYPVYPCIAVFHIYERRRDQTKPTSAVDSVHTHILFCTPVLETANFASNVHEGPTKGSDLRTRVFVHFIINMFLSRQLPAKVKFDSDKIDQNLQFSVFIMGPLHLRWKSCSLF